MLKRLANYTFDWKLSVFTLLLFPIMVNLGFWQLDREQEKIELQKIYNVRQAAPAEELDLLDWQGDLQYISVAMNGEFDNEHSFLLDNKINAGRVGFEIITPFITETGSLVFVNRGWLPQGKYRADFPFIEAVDGKVNVTASVYVPLGKQVVLGEDEKAASWPRLIQSLEPERLNELLGESVEKLFPYSVRLLENQHGVLTRNWQVISTKPEKHRGYAVQWFIMAGVLLMLYLYASTKIEIQPEIS